MDRIHMGQRIREARRQKGYTQRALAERADITDIFLGEIERGSRRPSLNSFIKLLDALDVSADYILRYELSSGQSFVYDELFEKLKPLTPRQRKTVFDIVDAYLQNLD